MIAPIASNESRKYTPLIQNSASGRPSYTVVDSSVVAMKPSHRKNDVRMPGISPIAPMNCNEFARIQASPRLEKKSVGIADNMPGLNASGDTPTIEPQRGPNTGG